MVIKRGEFVKAPFEVLTKNKAAKLMHTTLHSDLHFI